jgi:adenylosuccinate lyase
MHKGLSRTKAYDLVQRCAMKTWKGNTNFRDNLLEDKTVARFFSRRELDKIFDLDYYLRQVNKIFRKVGL